MELALIVLLPLLGAVIPPLVSGWHRTASAWISGALMGLALAILISVAGPVFRGLDVIAAWSWIPALDLELAFRLDGLSMLFAGLILGIGLLIILYARYYLPKADRMGRFYAFMLMFAGSMLGVVLSDHLLVLFVFWELTSLTSFLLVGYSFQSAQARQGARMALIVTGSGGLALLAGFLLLGQISGTYRISEILQMGELVKAHDLYTPTLILILLGAFTKSAQFPFHFWLPHAMAAPTPVSAYLHSATMVKAGVFLLARFFPVLAGTDIWFYLVGGAGLATLALGAYIALFKHDIKGLLAYSTISHLGLITLLFGFGTPLAAIAGVFHIINHATFKASLFMAAGIVDHEAGTRDMRELGGLWRFMPYTATLAMVAAAAMAGVPLLNGFLSKEMFFAEAIHVQWLGAANWLVPLMATLAAVFSVAYSIRFIHDVFFGEVAKSLPRTPHEPPRWMKIPVEVLVALCLLVGIVPALTVRPILDAAAHGVLIGEVPAYGLAIWHGFNLPLLMSAIALIGGAFIYSQRRHLYAWHDRYYPGWEAKALFEGLVDRVFAAARAFDRWFDNGSLARYAALLVAMMLVLGAAPFLNGGALLGPVPFTPLDGISVVAAAVLVVAAIGTVVMRERRLIALINVGAVGLVVTLAFIHFSAPDLAMTQITVELVTTVLLLLALFFLPGGEPRTVLPMSRRLRDGGLALLAGLGTAALTLAVLTRPYDPISGYFLEQAKPLGGGYNVVNVILVDFRGFDTLGEITVLAIAATGIFALLNGLKLPQPTHDLEGRRWAADAHPLILASISRPLLPLALLVAVYIFLRGHNMPGGGFIAGLIAGTALILQHLASGIHWTQERLYFRFLPVIAWGVLIATATGVAALLFGHAFLTSAFDYFHLPLIGEFELASAIAFDLGVFLAVVGTVMLILVNLGRLSHAELPHPRESRGEVS